MGVKKAHSNNLLYPSLLLYPINLPNYALMYDPEWKLRTNGAFKADGGLGAPLMWDSDNTAFRIDPAGRSVLNETYLNGASKLFFGAENQTGEFIYSHRGGSYPLVFAAGYADRLKIHSHGAVEVVPGNNLCLGGVCKNSWPSIQLGGQQDTNWQRADNGSGESWERRYTCPDGQMAVGFKLKGGYYLTEAAVICKPISVN